MGTTQIGALPTGETGKMLVLKLVEIFLKQKESTDFRRLGTSNEIKESIKIISEGIRYYPNIMSDLSIITGNMQYNQENFINNLLDKYADKTDKEIIISAIMSQSDIVKEDTKGFWNAIAIIGGVAIAAGAVIIKAKIDNDRKPFWHI